MLTILAFILTIGILVTIHEFGHFIVARWCDVKVLQFSIGFGKTLWSKKFGADHTELIIAAIPLGGFVKMLDEHASEQDQASQQNFSEYDLKRAFNRQPVLHKIAIVLAGPIANLLLAILLYWILLMSGVVGLKPTLGPLVERSAAAISGLTQGDEVKKVNGIVVNSWQDVRWQLLNASAKNMQITLLVLQKNKQEKQVLIETSSINHNDQQHDVLEQLGFRVELPLIKAVVGEVATNGAADHAGLKSKDFINAIDNKPISSWDQFVSIVKRSQNQKLNVEVVRGSEKINLVLIPEPVIENKQMVGHIGASFYVSQADLDRYFVVSKYSTIESFVRATQKTWDTSVFSLRMLGNMLTGQLSWRMMSGPVTIANYSGQSAKMGFKAYIEFLALISISIGILNLLPIPVLDGGHLMYYVIEILTGKPVSESIMLTGQKIGLLLIGSMMILAFYNDITRMITG